MFSGPAVRLLSAAILTGCLLHAQDNSAFIDEAKQLYQNVSQNVLKSAEEMPAADFSFRPTRESLSFADWIGNLASSGSHACSAIDGKPSVQDQNFSSENKESLIWLLRKSLQRCSLAYNSINNFNAGQQVTFNNISRTKLGISFLNASHMNEVYGHLAVYLRLKGLVPPSDRSLLVPITEARPLAPLK